MSLNCLLNCELFLFSVNISLSSTKMSFLSPVGLLKFQLIYFRYNFSNYSQTLFYERYSFPGISENTLGFLGSHQESTVSIITKYD